MLKGLGCLVTGGASGLGKATVERLVRQGRKVVILDIDGKKAQDVATALGKNVAVAAGCVTSEEDVKTAMRLIKDMSGGLGLIVNCAGIFDSKRIYNVNVSSKCTPENFNKILSINAYGTFNVIRLGHAIMISNKPGEDGQKGIIINTASVAGLDGECGQASNAAASGAIIAMTQPIARDLADIGIRVMTIATGLFETPPIKSKEKKITEYVKRTTPFPRRLGKPEEYAELVTTIMENNMLNGSVIRVDGGQRWHLV